MSCAFFVFSQGYGVRAKTHRALLFDMSSVLADPKLCFF